MDVSQDEGARKARELFESDLVLVTEGISAAYLPDPEPDPDDVPQPLIMVRVSGPEYCPGLTPDSPRLKVAVTLTEEEAAMVIARLSGLLLDNGHGELLVSTTFRELVEGKGTLN